MKDIPTTQFAVNIIIVRNALAQIVFGAIETKNVVQKVNPDMVKYALDPTQIQIVPSAMRVLS
jgi:hypothetical protein